MPLIKTDKYQKDAKNCINMENIEVENIEFKTI